MESNKTYLLELGIDELEQKSFVENPIALRKFFSRIESQARVQAKGCLCYHCNLQKSLCNSHSVPAFCLRRIAQDGKLSYLNTILKYPLEKEDQGVQEAGTFRIICNDCDSTIFQLYENPASYKERPAGKLLAQIAMKNYLLMVSKRLLERELYKLLVQEVGFDVVEEHQRQEIIRYDLQEFEQGYLRAKLCSKGNHPDWYNVVFFSILNYTVPIACQCCVALLCDFEGNIVNDVYSLGTSYKIQYLHIAVFPLESSSIVLLFVDSRNQRYRKFIKQLRNLPFDEQLSVINYIIISYTENVFFSKLIPNDVLENPEFIKATRKVCDAYSINSELNALPVAKDAFDLQKRNLIPNLLSSKYSI